MTAPRRGGTNSAVDIALLLQRANTGDARARTLLGAAYMDGDGVPRNLGLAERWLKMAAEDGITDAKLRLGMLYEQRRKLDLAEEWYTAAADDRSAEAMHRLGVLILRGALGQRPGREGVELLEKAAARGHAAAQEHLDVHVNGPGQRYSKKASYMARAELGDVGAQYALGNMLEADDPLGAATWFKMAAANGHSRAQCRLGTMYLEGRGVPRDPEEARELFLQAAAQGSAEARRRLEEDFR
jgi:TPR repeat protein